MNDMNLHEKEQAFEDFQLKRERMYKIGKVVIYTIAIINIVMALLSLLLKFNAISFWIDIILAIALIRGVTFVRYLFAAGAVYGSVNAIYFLINMVNYGIPTPLLIYFIIYLLYSISSAIVLFVSKGVTEFLYAQRNG